MKLLAKTIEEHTTLELTLNEFNIEQALQVLNFLKQERQNQGRWGTNAWDHPRLRIRVPRADTYQPGRVIFEAVLPDPRVPIPGPLPHFDLRTELEKETDEPCVGAVTYDILQRRTPDVKS